MKKLLLISVAALFALTGSAQLVEQAVDQEDTELGVAKAPILNDDELPAAAYIVPNGTFFSSFAKKCYNLTNPMLSIPAFADLTFTNASTAATSYLWSYVNPEGDYNILNPMTTSTEQNITVNYAYPTVTMIEAPVLTASNELGDSTTDLLTGSPKYLRVGNARLRGTENSEFTYYGWCNVSTKAGSMKYSTNRFCTNHGDSNSAWANSTGMSNVSVRGFGELYYKPARPYALYGFACHFREVAPLTKPITLTIYKVSTKSNGILKDIEEELCTQTLTFDDFEAAGTDRVYMVFDQLVDAKTGEVVEGYTIDFPIMVALTIPEGDTATQISAYYTATTIDFPTHNYVILDGTDTEGNEVKGMFRQAGLNYTNGTKARAFAAFSLLGAFQYVFDEQMGNENTLEAPADGITENFTLKSSVPYKDELGLETNWTAIQADGTELPDWITVNLTDNYQTVDGEKVYQNETMAEVTVSENNMRSEERSCDVKLAFIGGEYTIHVIQAGVTTGIQDVVAAQDDANAPTYNMMGQRVGADAKGLLIRGGKKILVK